MRRNIPIAIGFGESFPLQPTPPRAPDFIMTKVLFVVGMTILITCILEYSRTRGQALPGSAGHREYRALIPPRK